MPEIDRPTLVSRLTESRPKVQLPTLPLWEKLLSRLYALPDSAVDPKALRLELLGLASKESTSLDQLFSQLCVFLPKLTRCEGVIIWTKSADEWMVVASNLSAKKANLLVGAKAIQRLAKNSRYFFNQRSPVDLQTKQKRLTHYHLMSLGSYSHQEYYLISASSSPIANDTGRVFEIINQVLTLRLKSVDLAARLKQQELKLTNLTQQLGEGMAVLDQDLRVTLWNPAMERLTGRRATEVLGQPIDQVLPRAGQANWLTDFVGQPSRKGLGHLNADFEIKRKDGQGCWVSCLVSIYKNRAGQAEQVVVVARDISHNKTLESQKNDFISIATHELRTPLTAVRGYLSLLERKADNLTEKQRSYVARATQASDRLVNLAEDLLKVVQIEQNRIQFKPQLTHLGPMLKKIVRDFKPRATAKGLTLSLSKPVGSDQLRLDPERTEQIFANLIDNALKYTNAGSVKIFFEETGRNDQDRTLVINVRDTGIGINLKNVDEVFEKFQRAHRSEQSKEQGAGLGLYIVKSFIEKQGGTITVKSKVGRGTQFAVAFPLEQASIRRPK